jgi:hypothetical protein
MHSSDFYCSSRLLPSDLLLYSLKKQKQMEWSEEHRSEGAIDLNTSPTTFFLARAEFFFFRLGG